MILPGFSSTFRVLTSVNPLLLSKQQQICFLCRLFLLWTPFCLLINSFSEISVKVSFLLEHLLKIYKIKNKCINSKRQSFSSFLKELLETKEKCTHKFFLICDKRKITRIWLTKRIKVLKVLMGIKIFSFLIWNIWYLKVHDDILIWKSSIVYLG